MGLGIWGRIEGSERGGESPSILDEKRELMRLAPGVAHGGAVESPSEPRRCGSDLL